MTLFERIRTEGEQKGLEKGLEKGREEQLRQSTLLLLEGRFGPLSAGIHQRLARMPFAQLESLFRAAITAASLHDLGCAE
jgi:hypothetical protein